MLDVISGELRSDAGTQLFFVDSGADIPNRDNFSLFVQRFHTGEKSGELPLVCIFFVPMPVYRSYRIISKVYSMYSGIFFGTSPRKRRMPGVRHVATFVIHRSASHG